VRPTDEQVRAALEWFQKRYPNYSPDSVPLEELADLALFAAEREAAAVRECLSQYMGAIDPGKILVRAQTAEAELTALRAKLDEVTRERDDFKRAATPGECPSCGEFASIICPWDASLLVCCDCGVHLRLGAPR